VEGEPIEVNISHIFRDTTLNSTVVFTANEEKIELQPDHRKLTWTPQKTGPYLLEVIVYNEDREQLYASAPVDIQVNPKKPGI